MIEGNSSAPQYDYSILRPPQGVFKVKHSHNYIQRGEGKKAVRKIFYNVSWTPYEKAKLAEMNEEIRKQNIKLPADWSESETVRMIYNQRGDIPKCIESLKTYVEFLNDPKWHTLDSTILKYLQNGFIYVMGKDKQYRPIVVVNVSKINVKGEEGDNIIRALCYALRVITKHCFVPGHVENWVMLVDVNGAGLLNFPVNALGKIISTTSLYFSSCLEKLYIMNPSFALNTAWNMIKGMIDPETAEKIIFLPKKNFKKLQANIDSSQIVKTYGGAHADLTSFWPPIRFTTEPPYQLETEQRAEGEEVWDDKPEEKKLDGMMISKEEIRLKEESKTRETSLASLKSDEPKPREEQAESESSRIHLETKQIQQQKDLAALEALDLPSEEYWKTEVAHIECYDLSKEIHQHMHFFQREEMKLSHWLANTNWLIQDSNPGTQESLN